MIILLSFLPRIMVNSAVITTPGGHDDLGMLIVPSMLAGYDWSGLIPQTSYYGFGYSVLYTPFLVWFKHDNYLLFQAIFALNAVVQTIMTLIIYHLLVKHYRICSRMESVLISTAVSYLSFTASCKVANDVVLPCVTFLFIWLLTVLFETTDKGKRNSLTMGLLLLMGYAQLLHSRSIVYWLGIICVVGLVKILYGEWLVNPWMFMVGGCLMYFGTSAFVSRVQGLIWTQTGELTNSTGVIGNMLKLGFGSIFKEESLKLFISLIGSNLFALIQYTNGLFLAGIAAILIFIKKGGWKKKAEDVSQHQQKLVIGAAFSLICFGLMFGGLCISYLYPALAAYQENRSYSGFFYLRYYYNFGMPMVLYGLLYSLNLIRERKKKRILSALFLTFFACYFTVVVFLGELPLRDYWTSFGAKYGGDDQSILEPISYKMVFWGTVVWFSFFLLLIHKSRKVGLTFLLIVCYYGYSYQNLNSAKVWAENYEEKTDRFVKLLDEIDFNADEYYICVDGESAAYGLQLKRVEYTIHMDLSKNEENKKVLFFRYQETPELVKQGYREIVLSEDEYLYVQDEDTYRRMTEGKK